MKNIESVDLKSIGKEFNSCTSKLEELFVMGRHAELLDELNHKLRVGIVGTRNATPAGLSDTRKIAQVISEAGGIIVSGMALGVDGAAHQGALDKSGKTIAVLGSGVDVVYPYAHKKMYNEILEKGCVVSQFTPGTPAVTWHFPIRNKIIVALSDILVVTEGTLKGGARISVDLALDMGKTVLALPGPRRSYASELCNAVIKDGAGVITDPSDVLHEMGIDSDQLGWELTKPSHEYSLNGINKKVMDVLVHQNADSHDISILTNLSASAIASSLAFLEKNSLISYKRGRYQIM